MPAKESEHQQKVNDRIKIKIVPNFQQQNLLTFSPYLSPCVTGSCRLDVQDDVQGILWADVIAAFVVHGIYVSWDGGRECEGEERLFQNKLPNFFAVQKRVDSDSFNRYDVTVLQLILNHVCPLL